MENLLPVLNLPKVCRVCLEECENMFSIYSEIIEDNSEEEMPRIYEILICVSSIKVQTGDGFPTMICTKCIDKAHSSYKFQRQCNTSQSLLEAYIEQMKDLKIEDIESINQKMNSKHDSVKINSYTENINCSKVSHSMSDNITCPKDADDFTDHNINCAIKSDNFLEGTIVHLVGSDECSENNILCPEESDDSSKNNIHNTILPPDIKDINMHINCKQEIYINGTSDNELACPVGADNLPPELERLDEDDLLKNDDDMGDTNDCDALKNCLPLGEETVDQLLKDNLEVDNLELITPKLRAFNFATKTFDDDSFITVRKNSSKEIIPNMNYYRKDKDFDTLHEYECNICEKSFRFANSLRIHLKGHDEKKPYVCTKCRKAFKVYGSLIHHIRSHSGEQPFECKECGKKYRQSGTLTAHMRIHTGAKPFLCNICGRGFRQAPDLTYHTRTHTKEKPYMCNICGKTMSMQCHLVQHMRSHTGEKPFKCLECEKAFPSSTRLKRHSITHTSLKPYQCNVCSKSFNRSSSLRVHTKIHTGVRTHICKICNRGFTWAHSLRAHLLTHTKSSKEIEEKKVITQTVPDTNLDNSTVEFSTMTIYSDPSIEKAADNESLAIYSTTNDGMQSEIFQIYAVCPTDENGGLESFTLYSAETNSEHVSSLTDTAQLPTVSM